MARLVYHMLNEQAFRRERIIRDRSNPLDVYDDTELVERFRLNRRDLFELIDELSPELRHASDRNAALSPALQTLMALRFYANAPSEHEYRYANRKGFHSINVQIACDASYKIFDLVARWPGSTHDARIFRESALVREFEAGRGNDLLLGDSGYPLKRWLMTPVIALRTEQERRYNNIHSVTRSVVERCIGVLKRR
ncbi:hypothetical protein SKAU_G00157730 [Synaphobranchus kaupii]|uniref:DDE Tnp4 domain-containing protein n=1 Tax=Synaphobranchus kaupii TaxID=118154 RepID=A0A9Q1FI27_SYNKA|nr:hypothetical protein SKAU_G00157730 [Synaphobranchus kaupii]